MKFERQLQSWPGALVERPGAWGRPALLLFALASVWQTAPANLGLGFALLAAGFALRQHWQKGDRPDAVGYAAILLMVWLSLRIVLQGFGLADAALVRPAAGYVDWLAPLSFVLLASLMSPAHWRRWLCLLWLLALAGCTIGVLGFLLAKGPMILWSDQRLGFHLNRALGIGLYAGVFLILLVASARYWWQVASPWRWPVRVLALALILLYGQVQFSAQNRSTWLALLIVVLVALPWWGWRMRRSNALGWQRLVLLSLVIGGILVMAGIANRNALQARLGAEHDVVRTISETGLSSTSYSSISARLRLWQFVLTRWPDARWMGHGFGGMQETVDAFGRGIAHRPDEERFDHVHNSYLQTLWTQGVIGVALWTALIVLLLRDVHRAARFNAEVRALLPALWAALGFVALWACFDYRLSHPDMRCFSILLLLSLRLLGQAGTEGSTAPSSSA